MTTKLFDSIKLISRDLEKNKQLMAGGYLLTAYKDCRYEDLYNICAEDLENSFCHHKDIQPYIVDNEIKDLIIYVILLHVFYKANIWKTIGRNKL